MYDYISIKPRCIDQQSHIPLPQATHLPPPHPFFLHPAIFARSAHQSRVRCVDGGGVEAYLLQSMGQIRWDAHGVIALLCRLNVCAARSFHLLYCATLHWCTNLVNVDDGGMRNCQPHVNIGLLSFLIFAYSLSLAGFLKRMQVIKELKAFFWILFFNIKAMIDIKTE